MKILYLLINFCTVIIAFIFSFHPKIQFYKHFKAFFIANIIAAFLFIIWDIIFTKLSIWGFNQKYLIGIYLFNLPLEEILFFICIPFSCLFTYHCLNKCYKISLSKSIESIIIISLSSLLFITGICNINHLYTSVTFISLALFLMLLKYVFNVNWLAKIIIIYPVLLIPFFIVNGILTGSFLDEPVVYYNNNQNMGIRLFTIPFEDLFYGFELIILNLFFYEKLKNKIY